jgi:hypothetical protein
MYSVPSSSSNPTQTQTQHTGLETTPNQSYFCNRLCPLDGTYILDQELDRVRNLLEFETAARYLMAAQFRKNEINPLDYIYAAMGCSIQPLEVNLNLKTYSGDPKFGLSSDGTHLITGRINFR